MQQRSEETRSRILETATQLFSQRGYDVTGVAEICAAAGVSKGAFYHHFPSKQAVFMTLLEAWLSELDAGFELIRRQSPDVSTAVVQMARMVGEVFQAADVRLSIFLEFWMQAHRDVEIWQTAIAPYRRYHALFAELIRQGIAEGSLRPVEPEAAARLIVSQAIGLLMQALFDPQGANWVVEVEQSMRLLMDGLSRSKEGSA